MEHEVIDKSLTAYAFFKDFAGVMATTLAATVAAAITYYFNRAQARIASTQADVAIERLKLDLFEKRYAIYSSAKQLVEYLVLQNDFNKVDHMKVRSFYVTLDEGRFFLPDNVRKVLNELQGVSEDFLKVLGDRSNLDADDVETWRSAGEKAAAFHAKLREAYGKLPLAFEEALAFKQIKRT
jgi:hypothetical protein